MRKLLLLSVCLSSVAMVKAQYPTSLVLRLADGAEPVWELSSVERISFSGNNMLIDVKTGATETFALSTVGKLYFSNSVNSIECIDTQTTESSLVTKIDAQTIKVHCKAGSSVELYRVDGCKVMNVFSESEGCAINISRLSKGVYVVKVANRVTKFIKL